MVAAFLLIRDLLERNKRIRRAAKGYRRVGGVVLCWADMPAQLYAMLTWTTRDREPLIDAAGAEFLKRFIPPAARRQGADVLAVGVVRDHVHVVLHLFPIVDIPRLVQGLKGASARVANRDGVMADRKLRWAAGYDLRSLSHSHLMRAIKYVEQQSWRHPRTAIADRASTRQRL